MVTGVDEMMADEVDKLPSMAWRTILVEDTLGTGVVTGQ